MEARELRIGNYLFLNKYGVNKNIQIEGMHYNPINNHQSILYKGALIPIYDVSTIPLTEEWLIRFGFEKFEYFDEIWYSNDEHGIGVNKKGYWLRVQGMQISEEFNSVHQLQNLYFSLTGQELILK